MDRLNKWYLDSSWKTKDMIKDQVKIIKQVAKEHRLKASIKIKVEENWNNIYVKLNKLKSKK